MLFGSVPLSFADSSPGKWSVSYDAAAYSAGTLSVEVYDASAGYAPEIKWTSGNGTLAANKTPQELFTAAGDYYAVVQYQSGASADPSNLTDAQIEAEFDKYWIALYGSLPEEQGSDGDGYPSDYPHWGRDDALEWYEYILDDVDFIAWLEDDGWDLPLPTADQIVEESENFYADDLSDPDSDPDEIQYWIDSDIVEAVNEIAEAYIDYSGAAAGGDASYQYYQYDINTKRSLIMSCIQYPQMAPAGYTPPGQGSSEAFVKSVVHLLTAAEKANGLTVGSSFFDACVPLEITPMQVGEIFDYHTYQNVPLYAETAIWREFGDISVPAAIKSREQQEETESVDPIMDGLIGNLYGRQSESAVLTGLVDTEVPLYVEPGTYMVTSVSSASPDTDDEYSIIDWEQVSVNNAGGSVSFEGNRSYATVNIEGSVINAAPNMMSLKLSLSGGDLKTASVDTELLSIGFDMTEETYVHQLVPLKIRPGTYGDVMVTNSCSNMDMESGIQSGEVVFVCSFWEKNDLGTLAAASDTAWTIPGLQQNGNSFTASLEFTGADGGEAPFAEGSSVNGRMVLDAGDWKLASAVVMKQDVESAEQYDPLAFDYISVLATRAEYADGTLITSAAGVEHTWFAFEAPEESSEVNARAYLKVDGIIDLDFSASALLDTGSGTGEITELGSAEFSASGCTLSDGFLTLSGTNTGALSFTYTPEEGQADPGSVSVKLVYLDAAGDRKSISTPLFGSSFFTGTVDIPEDAAILESAVFSSPSGKLLSKNLQAIVVLANASVSLDASGYGLASEFDQLKLVYGRKVYVLNKSASVFRGLCPRGAYRRQANGDGMALFYIADEPFLFGGSLDAFSAGSDSFALDTGLLPDKMRVDMLGEFRESDIASSGTFSVAGRDIAAPVSSSYYDNSGYHFYLERPSAASEAENIKLTLDCNSFSYCLSSESGEASGNGVLINAPFARGEAFEAECRMEVRFIRDYMYMDVLCGPDGLIELVQSRDADMILCAIVGTGGLLPVMEAVRAGKEIALASKEVLVMAGEPVMKLIREKKSVLIPVDSEHSAVFQCLNSLDSSRAANLILTSSGGPFRKASREIMEKATFQQALVHPVWSMGQKISLDSATLMNKALEMVEAHFLFDCPEERIQVLVHPQSIVHSMVEFPDGVVLAQLGVPDMRFPIQYAFTWPDRVPGGLEKLNLAKLGHLDFEEPDTERFPALDLARHAIREGGTLPCVMNAANEIAFLRFKNGEIRFTDIIGIIAKTMDRHNNIRNASLEEILDADQAARAFARTVQTRELR